MIKSSLLQQISQLRKRQITASKYILVPAAVAAHKQIIVRDVYTSLTSGEIQERREIASYLGALGGNGKRGESTKTRAEQKSRHPADVKMG